MKDLFKDKTILITGGTGFLGRLLVKRLLKENPLTIRIFSRDEVKHYRLKEQLKDPEVKLRFLVGDVRDYPRLKSAVQGCDIVIHAAAMKRIDLIEYNVEESIKTNVLGTLNIVRACLENNVKNAIYVSSDKACSPINSYGACKFISERIFTESNFNKGESETVFSSVRYGNVLESTGSLVPAIIEKIKNEEDIPLTDKAMTRFFITGEEAVDLIFKAVELSVGGEIFVPKLESFKVIDIMELLGENYGHKGKIKVIGIRPGEKIHELMFNSSESPRTFEFDGIFIIHSQIEQYQDKLDYNYLKDRKLVDFQEYSSKDFIISKDALEEKIKEYGIIS